MRRRTAGLLGGGMLLATCFATTDGVAHTSRAEAAPTSSPELVPFIGTFRVAATWGAPSSNYHAATDEAIDFEMPVGTAVYAAGAGKVTEASVDNRQCNPNNNIPAGGTFQDGVNSCIRKGYRGTRVRIDHADGRFSQYLHLSAIQPGIKVNSTVTAGQRIGSSGNTGITTGPHLHYQEGLIGGDASVDPGPMTACQGTSVSYSGMQQRVGQTVRNDAFGCSAAVNLAQFANSIVKWSGDSVTSWYVSPDLQRLWIPDGGTFNELKARGVPGPFVLEASVLDRLPDRRNEWVASGATWTGNRELRRGMSVRSGDGRYTFVMQGDGNLVLYGPSGRAVWATSFVTGAWRNQEFVIFQADGNLVTYGGGRAIWSSATAGRGADRFVVQSDGNLVIYRGSTPVWSTGTGGRT